MRWLAFNLRSLVYYNRRIFLFHAKQQNILNTKTQKWKHDRSTAFERLVI